MVIAKEMSFLEIVEELIERNRKHGAGDKYMSFLIRVYDAAYRDRDLANGLETCLHFSVGYAPTIEVVERALARMDGGIRPLLEQVGVVEPQPKAE